MRFIRGVSAVLGSPELQHEHGEGCPQGEVDEAEENGEPEGGIGDEGDEIHEG